MTNFTTLPMGSENFTYQANSNFKQDNTFYLRGKTESMCRVPSCSFSWWNRGSASSDSLFSLTEGFACRFISPQKTYNLGFVKHWISSTERWNEFSLCLSPSSPPSLYQCCISLSPLSLSVLYLSLLPSLSFSAVSLSPPLSLSQCCISLPLSLSVLYLSPPLSLSVLYVSLPQVPRALVNLVELLYLVPLRKLHQESSLQCPTLLVQWVSLHRTAHYEG